ncbi:MAG: flotillin family protein, partial [Flavobacterium sp.]|nr:flotillin family protein [Flavobacterium sp.]
MTTITNYWWVMVLILCLILYKFVLRVFFGMVIVPEDKIGLVTKKFVLFGSEKSLPDGRIIATKGEA